MFWCSDIGHPILALALALSGPVPFTSHTQKKDMISERIDIGDGGGDDEQRYTYGHHQPWIDVRSEFLFGIKVADEARCRLKARFLLLGHDRPALVDI